MKVVDQDVRIRNYIFRIKALLSFSYVNENTLRYVWIQY